MDTKPVLPDTGRLARIMQKAQGAGEIAGSERLGEPPRQLARRAKVVDEQVATTAHR